MTVRDDLVVTLPRHARRDMKVSVVYDKPVPAPVKQGDQIGKIVVNAPDMPPIERPLYAAKNVRPISTAEDRRRAGRACRELAAAAARLSTLQGAAALYRRPMGGREQFRQGDGQLFGRVVLGDARL